MGGFGNGCYQAVDLALAVDTLPDAAEAARYLGVWGVGAFVGVCLGPLFGASRVGSRAIPCRWLGGASCRAGCGHRRLA